MIEAAGGVVLMKKPAWLDEKEGADVGGACTVPFHAQKCQTAKRVSYFVIEEEKPVEEKDVDKISSLRVFRRCPQIGYATKSWLLDCFDRYEIIDAEDFADEVVSGSEGDTLE